VPGGEGVRGFDDCSKKRNGPGFSFFARADPRGWRVSIQIILFSVQGLSLGPGAQGWALRVEGLGSRV
jgi:hypothetical protein